MSSFKERFISTAKSSDSFPTLTVQQHRLLSNPFQGPFCNVAKETRVFFPVNGWFSSARLIFQWMVDFPVNGWCLFTLDLFESWNVGLFFGGKCSRDFGVFGPENHVAISTQTIIHSDVGKQLQNIRYHSLFELLLHFREEDSLITIESSLKWHQGGWERTGWGRVKSPATNEPKTKLSEQPYEQGSHDQHD